MRRRPHGFITPESKRSCVEIPRALRKSSPMESQSILHLPFF
jgi:hypothetical protein